MVYSQMLETMWMNQLGSLVGSLAILMVFLYICFKRKLGIPETLLVVFPVVIAVTTNGCFGTTTSGCIPVYVSGSIVLLIGILWGLALLKALRVQEIYISLYMLFICANMALVFFNYQFVEYDPNTFSANFNTNISAATSANSSVLYSISPEILYYRASPVLAVLTGGAILGFLRGTGMPSTVVWFLSVPIQLLAFISLFYFLKIIIDIVVAGKNILMGIISSIIPIFRG